MVGLFVTIVILKMYVSVLLNVYALLDVRRYSGRSGCFSVVGVSHIAIM